MDELFDGNIKVAAPLLIGASEPGERLVEPADVGGETCGICYENYKASDFHGIELCSHRFCLNCMTDYITFNITNGKV